LFYCLESEALFLMNKGKQEDVGLHVFSLASRPASAECGAENIADARLKDL